MQAFDRRPGAGQRVIIVGGGIAGLVSAYEPARAGHDPLILAAIHEAPVAAAAS
jgi:monoamine oxidase